MDMQDADRALILYDEQAGDLALVHQPKRLGRQGIGANRARLRGHHLARAKL